MRRIIYQSLAAPDLDRVEMFRLVYLVRAANEARGLCGFMLRIDDRIFQVLEGEALKLTAAFESIRRDPRHRQIEMIDDRPTERAAFAAWRMRFFDGRNIPRMFAQITDAAGGDVPHSVQNAILDFLGPDLIRPVTEAVATPALPLLTEAAPPLSPRPC